MSDTILVTQTSGEAVSDTASMSIPDTARLYSVLLEWDPRDANYVVTMPELPGCRTHGRARAETVAQAKTPSRDGSGPSTTPASPSPRLAFSRTARMATINDRSIRTGGRGRHGDDGAGHSRDHGARRLAGVYLRAHRGERGARPCRRRGGAVLSG